KKLGLFTREQDDDKLFSTLLELMEKYEADYTDTFLALTYNNSLDNKLFSSDEFSAWRDQWQERINQENKSKQEVKDTMLHTNPSLITRNHPVETASDAAVNESNYNKTKQLPSASQHPFAHTQKPKALSKIPVPNTPYQTISGP